MIELSVIIPTLNRAKLLEAAIQSVAAGTTSRYEIIVVDGASDDDTPTVVADAAKMLGDRIRHIREPRREGFVKAANKGFRVATGRWMCWLNDDARPRPGAFDAAIAQLSVSPPDVGLVAMFHRWASPRNIAYEAVIGSEVYRLCHVRGTLYANFGMGPRSAFERVGLFDERYFLYGADPDLSLKMWHAGLRVEPAWGAAIDHDEHEDDRRAADSSTGQSDNRKLFEKWDLPDRNLYQNDFDPARPCTLRGLRSVTPQRREAA
jgi:GT2 family glycosyltransferase